MFSDEFALTQVATDDLRTILRHLHRGDLRCPLTPAELARFGLQHSAPRILGHLRGHEAPAVRAIVVAVIAERMEADDAS